MWVNILFYSICAFVGFVSFTKSLSGDHIYKKQIFLPPLAGCMLIYSFHMILFSMTSGETREAVKFLADLTLVCCLFLMFFYVITLQQIKGNYILVVIFTSIAVGITAAEIILFWLGNSRTQLNLFTFLVVFIASFASVVYCFGKKEYATANKKTSYMMAIMLAVVLLGYLLQEVVFNKYYNIMSLCFLAASIGTLIIMYFDKLEDKETVLRADALDIISSPTVLFDENLDLVFANQSAYKVLESIDNGYSLIKKTPEFIKMVKEDNITSAEIKMGGFTFEYAITKSFTSKGRLNGYIMTFHDVTLKNNQIKTAKRETKDKSAFLANMSHELRSPLHAIIGISDILVARHDISSKSRAMVRQIKRSSNNLLELVDAILDYSKLEAGKFELIEKNYSLESILEELTYNNIINLQSKPVELVVTMDSHFPKQLLGDAMRIREIFQNIIGNSVKFTNSGEIRVEVKCEQKDEEVHVFFNVTDTGAGVPKDRLDTMFMEYVSGSDEEMEGTGLGLTITRQIIERMGGSISAESDGSTGTTVYGDFYQKKGSDEECGSRVFNRRTVMQKSAQWTNNIRPTWLYSKARVLFADDMKINREIFGQLIEPWQCIVDMATDGADAVSLVRDNDYQLIFLDQMMEGMDGYEACSKIKEICDTPVVLVTANISDSVRNIYKEKGFSDYLPKPLKISDLKNILEERMPKEYQEIVPQDSMDYLSKRDLNGIKAYQRTLSTFVKEMEPLIMQLPVYAVDNHEMFAIKTHGLKGVSRQIGRNTFSDYSEVMEMASKADNWVYVEKHIDDYLMQLSEVVEDVQSELASMVPVDEPMIDEMPDLSITGVTDELLNELLEAFDEFNINKIEKKIELLNKMSLKEEEKDVLDRIVTAYEDLEYEEGSAILSSYLNRQ